MPRGLTVTIEGRQWRVDWLGKPDKADPTNRTRALVISCGGAAVSFSVDNVYDESRKDAVALLEALRGALSGWEDKP